jgi:hypothetical protein
LEKRLEKISRLPIGALNETVSEEMLFQLFDDDKNRDRMIYLSDVRNLLTHRYGIADRYFVGKYPSCGLRPGDKFIIDMYFIRDALNDMSAIARHIQSRAEKHFRFWYETKTVGRTEWWEEPDRSLSPLPPPSNG